MMIVYKRMPWQGDTNIRIDRFDGRSLLDHIPKYDDTKIEEEEDYSDREELNFERYHDLVEAERLNVTEKERLATVDEEWTKLLERHKALLALINPKKTKNNLIGFDYGTSASDSLINDDEQNQESDLLYEADILEYVNDLTEKDRRILNEMGMKYGIRNYTRLLRVAKRDRDEELKQLKLKQQGHDINQKKDGSRKSRKRKRRRRRRYSIDGDNNDENDSRYKRRGSPTYGNYDDDDDDDDDSYSDDETNSSEDDDSSVDGANQSDFVIEFGSTVDETQQKKSIGPKHNKKETNLNINDNNYAATSSTKTNTANNPQSKKLTPMEKLKMKMRAGLEKSIQSDANDKLRREKERQLEDLQQYALQQDSIGDFNSSAINNSSSINLLQKSTINSKSNQRYRSPSTSRSPSPERKRAPAPSRKNNRYRSPSTDSVSSSNDNNNKHQYHREYKKNHHRHDEDDNAQHEPKRYKREDNESSKGHRRYRSRSRSRHRSPTHKKSSKSSKSSHRHHRSRSPPSYRKSSSSHKRSSSPEKSSYHRSSRSYRK
ncbi:unnamed protein product [Cunninghamella blakesleeana]